mmetsp:Transcript_8983/g.37063  ORF Transcript_8983/g.37063 Transcript_8983/m.37063 type:complete len:205 (+) Transcript_8983:203-817(+)
MTKALFVGANASEYAVVRVEENVDVVVDVSGSKVVGEVCLEAMLGGSLVVVHELDRFAVLVVAALGCAVCRGTERLVLDLPDLQQVALHVGVPFLRRLQDLLHLLVRVRRVLDGSCDDRDEAHEAWPLVRLLCVVLGARLVPLNGDALVELALLVQFEHDLLVLAVEEVVRHLGDEVVEEVVPRVPEEEVEAQREAALVQAHVQ